MKPGIDFFVSALRPASILLDFAAELRRPTWVHHSGDNRIVAGIYYDGSGANPTEAEFARLAATRAEVQAICEADPDFRAAADRLKRAGVSYEFGGYGDYGGESAVFFRYGTEKSLAPLEALAADDAGILDPAARAEAAERFRIFLLRNYDENYQTNRQRYPDVGGYPYGDFWSPCGT